MTLYEGFIRVSWSLKDKIIKSKGLFMSPVEHLNVFISFSFEMH
jgi:hypothetical protein